MSTLDLHVGGTFANTKHRVRDAFERADRGEAVGETHITFESWEALTAVMTPNRFAIIRHLHRSPETDEATLARSLGLNMQTVGDDVDALIVAGLVERSEWGLHADYQEIRTEDRDLTPSGTRARQALSVGARPARRPADRRPQHRTRRR